MKLSNKSRPISFVVCAAGKGERFNKYGFTSPKPLLNLNGKTMLERSLDSLELKPEDQLIIVTLASHQLKQKFKNIIHAEWIEIESTTGGQLETFLFAKHIIKHESIVIYNCDTFFSSSTLRNEIENDLYDGLIPCSIETGESWSFCKVDETFNVLNVAEKRRISDWASVGYYYFKKKELLFNLAEAEVNNLKPKESYVAPLYEKYLQLGLKIKMVPVEKFSPFGTIEQVKDYWGIDLSDLLKQNKY